MRFDRFWVSDQTFHADPFVLLADLANRTRIPLGLAVTNPYARHPAQLARAMATLAQLHPERESISARTNARRVLAPLGLSARNGPRHIRVAIETIRRLTAGDTIAALPIQNSTLRSNRSRSRSTLPALRPLCRHARAADARARGGPGRRRRIRRGAADQRRDRMGARATRCRQPPRGARTIRASICQLAAGASAPGGRPDTGARHRLRRHADRFDSGPDVSEWTCRSRSPTASSQAVSPRARSPVTSLARRSLAAGTAAKLCELVDMARRRSRGMGGRIHGVTKGCSPCHDGVRARCDHAASRLQTVSHAGTYSAVLRFAGDDGRGRLSPLGQTAQARGGQELARPTSPPSRHCRSDASVLLPADARAEIGQMEPCETPARGRQRAA